MLEKLRSLRRALFYYPTSMKRRAALAGARWLFSGENAWSALEQLNVPGFGTDLIRVDFPPSNKLEPRWGYGHHPHPELAEIFSAEHEAHRELLAKLLIRASDCLSWPENSDATNVSMPWRANCFLTMLDMVASFGILCEVKPLRYVEVGSGMSTRVAWQARARGGFPMQIMSIDPCPRIEIEQLCDRVFRKPLENFPPADLVELSGPGSVFFIDGSHRSFPGSDVTVFFVEILPRLKTGTLVQIHDIYLPADYPAWAGERYWSEQYLLAAYLLGGGKNLRILLPCHFLGAVEPTKSEIERTLGQGSAISSSLWMEIVG